MKRVSLVIGCHLSSATVACGLMTAVGVLSGPITPRRAPTLHTARAV
jgi:hypothetical protein